MSWRDIFFKKSVDIQRIAWYYNIRKEVSTVTKKKRKKIKKMLRRFAWDVTVGATAGTITYLIAKLLG